MFERRNHRYTDLSEPGRGLSIFNDCKYGISVQGGTMALTLAKITRPDERGDVGTYTFRYAISPMRKASAPRCPAAACGSTVCPPCWPPMRPPCPVDHQPPQCSGRKP